MALFWITTTPGAAAPRPALSSLATALVLRLSMAPTSAEPLTKAETE